MRLSASSRNTLLSLSYLGTVELPFRSQLSVAREAFRLKDGTFITGTSGYREALGEGS
jgi:hypothetical protein